VTSLGLLVSVFVALIVLTAITVGVTRFDLGPNWNVTVAIAIATVKGILVGAFFMHLFWDRKFYLFAFSSSVLFLVLFLTFAMSDRSEYQPAIDQFRQAQQGGPGG
jgi:cytochrome c oxidase subunit 4